MMRFSRGSLLILDSRFLRASVRMLTSVCAPNSRRDLIENNSLEKGARQMFTRALAALAAFGLVSAAMADVVIYDEVSEKVMVHNPSYDNLYRPGTTMWRVRMHRHGLIEPINDVGE